MITEMADEYAYTYAGYIRAAVREVGQNYRQVANWLARERIPSQRNGRWTAQSVKNTTERYEKLTRRLGSLAVEAVLKPLVRELAAALTTEHKG